MPAPSARHTPGAISRGESHLPNDTQLELSKHGKPVAEPLQSHHRRRTRCRPYYLPLSRDEYDARIFGQRRIAGGELRWRQMAMSVALISYVRLVLARRRYSIRGSRRGNPTVSAVEQGSTGYKCYDAGSREGNYHPGDPASRTPMETNSADTALTIAVMVVQRQCCCMLDISFLVSLSNAQAHAACVSYLSRLHIPVTVTTTPPHEAR